MNACKAHAVETDMTLIKTLAELEAIYGKPVPRSIEKVVTTMTPHYRAWIEASD